MPVVDMEMGVGDRGVRVSLHPSELDLGDPGQIHYGTRGLCRGFKQTQVHMDAQTMLCVWTEYYKEHILPSNCGGEEMGLKR